MSFSIDVHVPLYASTSTSPFHAKANELLQSCSSGSNLFCLAWPTLMAYLGMVTHPAIVSPPLPVREAEQNVESLLQRSNVRLLSEQEGFGGIYRRSTRDSWAGRRTDFPLTPGLEALSIRDLETGPA